MKIESTLLADDLDKLKESTWALQYIYLDGIAFVSHSRIDGNVTIAEKQVRVVTDHTYSSFRKFSVMTTIVPVAPEGKPRVVRGRRRDVLATLPMGNEATSETTLMPNELAQ